MRIQKPKRLESPLTDEQVVDVNALVRSAWDVRGVLSRALYVVTHGKPTPEEAKMALGSLEAALEPFTVIVDRERP